MPHEALATGDPLALTGEELSTLLLQVGEVPSPRTRSALVIFEDGLQDDGTLAEVLEHLRRLEEAWDDAVPAAARNALAALRQRLLALPQDLPAAEFRSGFSRVRRQHG